MGVDISSIQGAVDFTKFAALGLSFVICRCYVGNDALDVNYACNIACAKAEGLSVMAYHYVYPLPTSAYHAYRDPVSQAQLHYASAGGVRAACDLEFPSPDKWAYWGVSASFIHDWTLAYLDAYEALDKRPMVFYTYPSFAVAVGLDAPFASRPLWIASYTAQPTIPAPWNVVRHMAR